MKLKKIVLTAMMAAICCVSTMVIKIPSPMQGYMNIGDGFVLLSGWVLGPAYGFAAAGIGSAFADLLGGYMLYVLPTFLIKGAMAFICGMMYMRCKNKNGKMALLNRLSASIISECIMVMGYFLFSAVFMGEGLAAAASIPLNVLQGVLGMFIGLNLFSAFEKFGVKDKYFS